MFFSMIGLIGEKGRYLLSAAILKLYAYKNDRIL